MKAVLDHLAISLPITSAFNLFREVFSVLALPVTDVEETLYPDLCSYRGDVLIYIPKPTTEEDFLESSRKKEIFSWFRAYGEVPEALCAERSIIGFIPVEITLYSNDADFCQDADLHGYADIYRLSDYYKKLGANNPKLLKCLRIEFFPQEGGWFVEPILDVNEPDMESLETESIGILWKPSNQKNLLAFKMALDKGKKFIQIPSVRDEIAA